MHGKESTSLETALISSKTDMSSFLESIFVSMHRKRRKMLPFLLISFFSTRIYWFTNMGTFFCLIRVHGNRNLAPPLFSCLSIEYLFIFIFYIIRGNNWSILLKHLFGCMKRKVLFFFGWGRGGNHLVGIRFFFPFIHFIQKVFSPIWILWFSRFWRSWSFSFPDLIWTPVRMNRLINCA